MINTEEAAKALEQLPGPRVTREGILDKIKETTYYTHKTLTICVAELENGFLIVGTAACVDPDNFNPKIGTHYAFEDVIRQCWPLLGYDLKNKLKSKESNLAPS